MGGRCLAVKGGIVFPDRHFASCFCPTIGMNCFSFFTRERNTKQAMTTWPIQWPFLSRCFSCTQQEMAANFNTAKRMRFDEDHFVMEKRAGDAQEEHCVIKIPLEET